MTRHFQRGPVRSNDQPVSIDTGGDGVKTHPHELIFGTLLLLFFDMIQKRGREQCALAVPDVGHVSVARECVEDVFVAVQ